MRRFFNSFSTQLYNTRTPSGTSVNWPSRQLRTTPLPEVRNLSRTLFTSAGARAHCHSGCQVKSSNPRTTFSGSEHPTVKLCRTRALHCAEVSSTEGASSWRSTDASKRQTSQTICLARLAPRSPAAPSHAKSAELHHHICAIDSGNVKSAPDISMPDHSATTRAHLACLAAHLSPDNEQSAVGQEVHILWPDDGVWYSAVVKELKLDQMWAKVTRSSRNCRLRLHLPAKTHLA